MSAKRPRQRGPRVEGSHGLWASRRAVPEMSIRVEIRLAAARSAAKRDRSCCT
jgi:hypothetical protein